MIQKAPYFAPNLLIENNKEKEKKKEENPNSNE